jgi:hypothetical protein
VVTVRKMALDAIPAFASQKPCTDCCLVADVDFLQLTLVMRKGALRIVAVPFAKQFWANPGFLQIWGLH